MPGVRNPRRATLAIAFVLAGCTRALEPATVAPAPVAPMDSIEVSLFLIGDAGSKAYDGEPVLKDLAKQSDCSERLTCHAEPQPSGGHDRHHKFLASAVCMRARSGSITAGSSLSITGVESYNS